MAQSISSAFVGDVFEDLLTALVLKTDIFDKSLAALHTGFNKALYLPIIDVTGTLVQDYKAQPTLTTDSSGVPTYSEELITLTDKMVFIDGINPNSWRAVWNEFAPDFNSLMLEMQVNPELTRAFITKIVERVSNVNAFNIWQGDVTTTGATYAEYDGLLTKLLAAGGYIDAKPTGTTGSFTASNINDYLNDVRQAMLAKPELISHPDNKIVVSHTTMGLYQDAQVAISGKGATQSNITDFSQNQGEMLFYDIPLYASAGFPDDVLLGSRLSMDPLNSTMHVGMRNVDDTENVKFERVNAYSESYFFKLAYSIGTEITTPSDIVLFDLRA